MKILHVYNHFYPCVGGVERYIEDLCVHLLKLGHISDVCCLNTCADSKETLKPLETYKGIRIYRIPYTDLKYYKIAPKVLKIAKKYDIIHVHGLGFFLDFLTSTKRFHKKPIILSTHGGIFHTKKLLFFKRIYFTLWSKRKLKKVDRIIAVSRNDEDLFSQISKNVVLIPDGIEYEKYSTVKRKPEEWTFLFVGRLSPNKRVDRLIKLVEILKSEIPEVKLYVAGKDWKGERKKLEELVRRRGVTNNVIFTGEISESEKLRLFSKAEFFLSASEYEGFGISVIEAMSAGVPVILNDIDAFRNLVKPFKNGFIINFSKPEDVKNLILEIKNKNHIPKISANARKEAKKYDWSSIIKEIENVYRRCV